MTDGAVVLRHTDMAKDLRSWGAVLYRPGFGSHCSKGRADRRFLRAPSVCHRTCHDVLPDHGARTLDGVMSTIVQGTHSMLETQTFDMNEYRAQKDKLEYEAMKRNPRNCIPCEQRGV